MPLNRAAKSAVAVASLALMVGGLGACKHNAASSSTTTGTITTGALPAGSDLMQQAETAMGTVQTVHFAINVDGSLDGLPVNSAQGDLTKAGDAKGTANISELGVTIQADFVIVGDSFYLKAATGGYQKLALSQAASVYDPSAILDPNRGIVKLLASASSPKTEAEESINGQPAYRVALTPDPTALATLVPGAGAGTTGKVWIDASTHRLVKGVFVVPSTTSTSTATVTITLTNYDAPVTVSAP